MESLTEGQAERGMPVAPNMPTPNPSEAITGPSAAPGTPTHTAQRMLPAALRAATPRAPIKTEQQQQPAMQASDMALLSGLIPMALATGDPMALLSSLFLPSPATGGPSSTQGRIAAQQVQPATAPGRGAGSGSGRFKWTDTEVELLFRVEELTQELFDSANAARQQQQEDRLDLPTHTAQAQVLSALLPVLTQGTITTRYTNIRKGKLARPHVQLSEEYAAAAQEAAEQLLSAAEEADAEGVTRRKRKPAAAAAAVGGEGRAVRQRGDDAAGSGAAPSTLVGGKIMPGARPENPPGNSRGAGKSSVLTLGQAREQKIKPHRMQRDQVSMLHDDHELFTWYQCTDQICQWGKKGCIGCGKPRPLKAHSLYSVEWSTVTYPDAGEWVEDRMITIKFMCPGCVLKHDDA